MDNILISIKTLLDIESSNTDFDNILKMHINTVISSLLQLNVGPQSGYKIVNGTETWNEYITDRIDIELIKSLVYLKVRLLFDPPQTSFLLDSIKNQINELEWRINIQVDTISNTII